ncbi:MAG TPA: alpha-amylase, partial [Flavobacteriales bacterium]|nr:alpha-amylase [Flavobacteriales bacterium]
DAMAVLAGTLLDMPLVYSGQESFNQDRLRFFEKDTVKWGDYDKADFYRTLNELNHTREALWNGDFGGSPQLLTTSADESVFAFYKQKGESTVVVILNFSAHAQTVKLDLPEAELTPAMGGFDVTGWEAGQEMAPYSFAVLATAS